MNKKLEFFFDFTSPYSYLAWAQLPELTAKNSVAIVWQPVSLGALFKASGNTSPIAFPAKEAYIRKDLADQARWHQVPFNFTAHFPIKNTLALRIVLACGSDLDRIKWIEKAFTAMWVQARDLSQPGVIEALLTEAGFDAKTLLVQAEEDNVRQALKQQTVNAIARGVFGAPTFFVNDEMFFGQDRLHLVRNALEKSASDQA